VSTPARTPRVSSAEARRRILEAARALLLEVAFAELTVDSVMARAGLTRTIFYRHYADLPQMAPDLLPDEGDPLVARIERTRGSDPHAVVAEMIAGLVDLYARHGPLLRAIDAAAARDRAVAERLETALVGPRRLLAGLIAAAPHPPADPRESARMLMATHRAYLLDTFGDGRPRRGARRAATRALEDLWSRLLA
jgi:AcrR family transcriptional regulator